MTTASLVNPELLSHGTLECNDTPKLTSGDVVMPLHQVLIAEHEVGRG